jgi:flavin-dependent thymidylate synthase
MQNSVTLIGTYGGDLEHACSAWTSTSRELTNEKIGRIPELLKFLAANEHHCYDDKTEILTNSGWKFFKDLLESDLVLAVNIENFFASFEKPQQIFSDSYNEPMYYVENDKISLAVTKGHRLVVSQKRKSDGSDYGNVWEFQTPNVVEGQNRKYESSCFIRNFEDIFEQNKAKLIGFFIGDGSIEPSGRITFHLKLDRKIAYLKALGYTVLEKKNNKFIIDDKELGKWLKINCYDHNNNKKLPDNYLTFSKYDTHYIFDGLKNSDGTLKRNTWVYSTCSPILKDQLKTLAAIHGGSFTESVIKKRNPKWKDLYRLNYSKSSVSEITNQKSRKGKDTEYWAHYNGMVYCVTVSTGAVLVRRNGKICVSGNTPFEKSMLHFLVVCDTASHIHLIKHRIGVSVNAESARYKELKDDKFYIPEDWPKHLRIRYANLCKDLYYNYHDILEELVMEGMDRKRAKESARFILPYANQLTLDVSFNFRSFMLFQKLRNDEHAQKEIREIAQKMLQLVRDTHKFDASLVAFGY